MRVHALTFEPNQAHSGLACVPTSACERVFCGVLAFVRAHAYGCPHRNICQCSCTCLTHIGNAYIVHAANLVEGDQALGETYARTVQGAVQRAKAT